jgi:CBS domain-containing protein
MSFESLRTVLDETPLAAAPSIAATASVSAAIALMKSCDADVVMAMADGCIAGLLTARDALVRVFGAARNADTTRIIDVSHKSPAVDVNTSVTRALDLMNESDSDHVTVSANGRLIGVLSRHELTRWIIRNQQEQLDCAIRAVRSMGYSNRRG